MSVPHAAQSARAQLSALATSAQAHESDWLTALPATEGARSAAVLMLFGVMDSLPSDHEAQASAVSRDLDVLLLARATTLRSHPGQIAFPGGRIDPEDDSAIAASLREAQEETGLDPRGIEVLGALETVPLAVSQHLVTPVLAWWERPSPVHVVDEAESAHVFRAPVADLLDPANRGMTVLQREGTEWRAPAFHVPQGENKYLIWGFTAMLLDGLFAQLGWTEPWDATRELPIVTPL